MIQPQLFKVLENAVDSPASWASGANLGRLRAAFDGACAQICEGVIKTQPQNRMTARILLNRQVGEDDGKDSEKVLKALGDALRVCEHTLYRKDYADHSSSVEQFIRKELGALVELLR